MSDIAKQQVEANMPAQKKAYKTPEVVAYGTVADLTHTSGTPGLIFDGVTGPNKAS